MNPDIEEGLTGRGAGICESHSRKEDVFRMSSGLETPRNFSRARKIVTSKAPQTGPEASALQHVLQRM